MSGSRARIALIDADSVLYAVAMSGEVLSKSAGENADEEQYFQVKDVDECYTEVVSRLETLVQEVGAETAIICLTPTTSSFRYNLLSTYKANRATFRRPALLKPLQYAVVERKPFKTLAVRGLEADDVCGISQGKLQEAGLREPVIVSIDKDMRQIPGLNYSWMEAARKQTVGQLNDISEHEADRMHLYQTLVGDVVDNYTGCPGIGPKRANALLDSVLENCGVFDWKWIVEAFRKKGYTEEYALTQARVARILRVSDWDPIKKEVTLWKPPTTPSNVTASSSTVVSRSTPKHSGGMSVEPLDASTVTASKILLSEVMKARASDTVH